MDTASDSSGQSFELAGTAVNVNGVPAPIVFASPTQVIFECPHAPGGTTLNVAVATAAGVSGSFTATIRESALGVFTVNGSAKGQAVATTLDGSQFAMPRNHLHPGLPAQPGDSLNILATGLSENASPDSLTVMFADVPAPARWVRAVVGAVGVTQIGVSIPGAAPVGDSVPLRVQQRLPDGTTLTSQTVSIAIEPVRQ
jgi:uncharacterized protein (TIGR03437 family)